jgi:O-antigen ligase
MTDRLAFGGGLGGWRPRRRPATPRTASPTAHVGERAALPRAQAAGAEAGADWAWRGLLGFTLVLFLRPQDQLPLLAVLRLAEIFAIVGLAGMVLGRLSRGDSPFPVTPEVIGLLAFGGAMVIGVPFSFWPGGSVKVIVEIYLKVLVIVMLMIHALDRPQRLSRFTGLIVLSIGYIAARAIFDYARGVNLVEGDRIGGAVGGIFGNPNDLALNMVVFLPIALAAAFKPGAALVRLSAGGCALLMIATVVLTRSRGGAVGLVVMLAALVVVSIRIRPTIAVTAVVVTMAALPLAPASFWHRMGSIFDEQQDTTGSRQARIDLLHQAWAVFLDNPVIGVGVGQFVNYKPDERKEAWNVTHNAVLQVAAELGIVGLLPFGYLIARTGSAARTATQALLSAAPPVKGQAARRAAPTDPVHDTLLTLSTALLPAIVGWFACALFASVALNWTFYIVLGLAVATRETVLRAVRTPPYAPARVA